MELLFLNSLSKDGNMAESLEPGVGLKNSELFFNKNKIPIENTIFIDILDSNVIKEYDKSLVEISEYGVRYISADALITKKNNLFIYQKFGDCIPFTVYDTENNTLVFAHLGVVSVINLLHKEIIKKLTEIRKTRLIDIYAEEEFFGKGLIVNKEGKAYIYNWCISLCIEENLAKEQYELKEYNSDINKINIDYTFDENKNICNAFITSYNS